MNGLGAPFWDGEIRASIENINSSYNKNDILRAGFESVAFSTKSIVDSIEKTINYKIKSIKIDGGLSRSIFFNQLLSNLLNIVVRVDNNNEMTSLGVAKLSLENISKKKLSYNSYKYFFPEKENYNRINKTSFNVDKLSTNILF